MAAIMHVKPYRRPAARCFPDPTTKVIANLDFIRIRSTLVRLARSIQRLPYAALMPIADAPPFERHLPIGEAVDLHDWQPRQARTIGQVRAPQRAGDADHPRQTIPCLAGQQPGHRATGREPGRIYSIEVERGARPRLFQQSEGKSHIVARRALARWIGARPIA